MYPAARTALGRIGRDRITAVMADKILLTGTLVVMKRHGDGAVNACRCGTAVAADKSPRIAASVKEEHYLLTFRQRDRYGLPERD